MAIESLLAAAAGKAWRSATEMVVSPDLLHAAQEHIRAPRHTDMQKNQPGEAQGWVR